MKATDGSSHSCLSLLTSIYAVMIFLFILVSLRLYFANKKFGAESLAISRITLIMPSFNLMPWLLAKLAGFLAATISAMRDDVFFKIASLSCAIHKDPNNMAGITTEIIKKNRAVI